MQLKNKVNSGDIAQETQTQEGQKHQRTKDLILCIINILHIFSRFSKLGKMKMQVLLVYFAQMLKIKHIPVNSLHSWSDVIINCCSFCHCIYVTADVQTNRSIFCDMTLISALTYSFLYQNNMEKQEETNVTTVLVGMALV